jgi:hypothetical protein
LAANIEGGSELFGRNPCMTIRLEIGDRRLIRDRSRSRRDLAELSQKRRNEETLSGTNHKDIRCQFTPDFLLCYRVFGCFPATGVQNTTKNVLPKKSCRKVFTKKSTKNPKLVQIIPI